MMARAPNAAAISLMWALVAVEVMMISTSLCMFIASLILWVSTRTIPPGT